MFFAEAHAAVGMPLAGTEIARSFDSLWSFVLWLSVFFFVLVVGGMVYLAIKYRASAGAKPKYITGSHFLEALWTAIPTALLLVIFAWGYVVYNKMTRAPSDAMEIRGVGKQWLWQFQYADTGRTLVNEFYFPINKPVKLVMSSEDVLHSFFIPSFRVKQDVVPGMYTTVWFEATVPGKHQVFCTEYCGTSHSQMLAQAVALTPEDFEAWKMGKEFRNVPRAGELASKAVAADGTDQVRLVAAAANAGSLAQQGKKVMEQKGCIACHSDDGSRKIGPSYKGLFGSKVVLMDGSTVTADEAYLRESIENPNAKVVKGYAPTMPTFKGLLTETEMNAVLAYIKSLK
jgi:cytochrome c oxidase subunit 2